MEIEIIKPKIIEVISKIFIDDSFDIDIVDCVNLIDDLGMDSLIFISIVVEIESYFNIEIPNDMLLFENFKSVDAIVSIVKNELSRENRRI